MAHTTGTAANATAFYAALINYLKTDPTLVSLGQNWTEVWSGAGLYATDKVLRGPGMSATEQIFVGFRLEESNPGDSYRLSIVGMTGFIATATQFTEHVNVSPIVCTNLDVAAMTYWIVASGRRFVFVTKISTIYEIGYGGFFLPYGDPVAYPYPMFVGGTSRKTNTGLHDIITWRSTDNAHRNFAHGDFVNAQSRSPALMLDPIGQWKEVSGVSPSLSDVAMAPSSFGPYSGAFNPDGKHLDIKNNLSPSFDGSYALTPFTLIQVSPAQTYGVLDGVKHVAGQGNSSENLITVSGVNHLVVQNIFRTETGEYLALRLE
jgi:hypothetical protein